MQPASARAHTAPLPPRPARMAALALVPATPLTTAARACAAKQHAAVLAAVAASAPQAIGSTEAARPPPNSTGTRPVLSQPPHAVPPADALPPPRLPKRPARSRRLRPEALDPEDAAGYTEFYPLLPTHYPWEQAGGPAACPTPGNAAPTPLAAPLPKSSSTPSAPSAPSTPSPLLGARGMAATGTAVESGSRATATPPSGLPECYRPLLALVPSQAARVWGAEEVPQGLAAAMGAEVEGLRRRGGFLKGPQQVAALLQPRQPPSARQLLGLGLDYADHFFSGPDYRYTVDQQGRLVDMVAHVRTRVPARFDRARPTAGAPPGMPGPAAQGLLQPDPSLSPATPAPPFSSLTLGAAAPPPSTTEYLAEPPGSSSGAALHALVLEARAAGAEPMVAQPMVANGEGEELVGYPVGGEEGMEAGVLGASWQAVLQQEAQEVQGMGVDAERGGKGRDLAEDARCPLPAARARVGGGYLGDEAGTGASRARAEDAYLDDGMTHGAGSLQAPLTPAGELASRRPLVARNVAARHGGSSRAAAAPSFPRTGVTFRAVPVPADLVLRVFTYCIGPSDLFHGLWDLELLEQVRFVQRIEDADVVVHRRPQPGEKQFAYHTFRQRAQDLGIPFVSLWNGNASEIQRSLLPVFVLYAGLASPEEVAFASAPGLARKKGSKAGKKVVKGARRIRL